MCLNHIITSNIIRTIRGFHSGGAGQEENIKYKILSVSEYLQSFNESIKDGRQPATEKNVLIILIIDVTTVLLSVIGILKSERISTF